MARMRTAAKRREILEGAAVVFARQGYHSATLSHVAKELGVGLGTIYRYFDSKAGLFRAIIETVTGEVVTAIAAESPTASETLDAYRAQVERIGRSLFESFKRNRAMATLLFVEAPGMSDDFRREMRLMLRFMAASTQAYLDNGVSRGFLRANLDTELTAILINALTYEGVRQYVEHQEAAPFLDRWLAAVLSLMFEGVGPRPG